MVYVYSASSGQTSQDESDTHSYSVIPHRNVSPMLGLCHNTLAPARTPRLGLCHNALTPARTPRLGLCHNALTPAGTPGLHQNAAMRCKVMWVLSSAMKRSSHKQNPRSRNRAKSSEDGVRLPMWWANKCSARKRYINSHFRTNHTFTVTTCQVEMQKQAEVKCWK